MAGRKKPSAREVVELDQTFMSIADTPPKRKKKSASTILVSIACLILLAAIAGGVWLLFSDNWLTMEPVTIAGVDLTGLTKKEAKETLQEAFLRYQTIPVTVTVMDDTLEIHPAAVGVRIDAETAVDTLYWTPDQFDIWDYVTMNTSAIRSVVETLGQKYNTDLTETTVQVEGTMPSLDPGAAETEGQTLVIKIGSPEMGLDTEDLYNRAVEAYISGIFAVSGECTVIDPSIPNAEALSEEHYIPPLDAYMDMTTFQVVPEKYGYGVDAAEISKQLTNTEYGQEIRVSFQRIAPEVVSGDLANMLFQDILGECTTPYGGYDSNDRNTNLRLSCEKMNGVVLMPGETFSYNLCLGERTPGNGWRPAASYVGGDTVDTYGGGICQGSSTLYNCVLQADLKINQRYNHGYISSYTQPGLDATVSWGAVDFVFTNSTNWPIKLEAHRQNGKYTVRIYGTDEKDYYVKMTYKILDSTPYETVYREIPENDNPKGYKDGDQIVDPYTGYTVVTYKNRYSKATNALIETVREATNRYSKRDRVIAKIIPTEASQPTETAQATE